MSSSLRNDPTLLEDRIRIWIASRDKLITSASAVFQASANPQVHTEGKRQRRKSDNLILRKYQEGEFVLKFGRKRLPYCVIFSLACMSWWLPEDLGSSIRFLISEEERIRWNLCHEELDIVLLSKAYCTLYLQEKVLSRGEDWIFGAIFTDKWTIRNKQGGHQSFQLFDQKDQTGVLPRYFYCIKKKPKPTVRKRGYRDHGTLRDESASIRLKEYHRDEYGPKAEEEYQAKKRKSWSVLQLLKGWFS